MSEEETDTMSWYCGIDDVPESDVFLFVPVPGQPIQYMLHAEQVSSKGAAALSTG